MPLAAPLSLTMHYVPPSAALKTFGQASSYLLLATLALTAVTAVAGSASTNARASGGEGPPSLSSCLPSQHSSHAWRSCEGVE